MSIAGRCRRRKKTPQPTQAERDTITNWIDSQFDSHRLRLNWRDPGHPTIRRLNRSEYNNTIRDLVGVNFQPAEDFPSDDVGYGFDNIGDVLSMPPILLEKYLSAADRILNEAIVVQYGRCKKGFLPASESFFQFGR